MDTLNAALLVNLLGFSVGIALYLLVAIMVVRHRDTRRAESVNILLLTTAALGLLWNVGELYGFVARDFGVATSPYLLAISFSALGFLPSVVVHSAQSEGSGTHWLTFSAYGLSTVATVMHLQAAVAGEFVPSELALRTLTVGSIALLIGLLILNLRQTLEKKAILAAALLVFAVSALHLSGEREGVFWYIELIAHQSSLPLALVILYQNYRFAFADLFLKRAVSLMLLSGLAAGLYVFAAVPLIRYHENHGRDDVQAAGLMVGLWIATALTYPSIYKFAGWLVDKVLLHRADYTKLQLDLAQEIESRASISEVLDAVSDKLGKALTARIADWKENADFSIATQLPTVEFTAHHARILVPTAETPQYSLNLADFFGGRRLLSDEIALLESVALVAARRIDVIRVSHERYEQKFREQEFAKLATEAQLTALRSQINPHFLFNALTTLGYLIKTSPDRAFDTLLRLTQLLRGVLKTTGEFCTLGEEINLIENYLDIEHARFEERLTVKIDLPEHLKNIRVPSLILQPIVENAIKHGISENRSGGEVRISAALTNGSSDPMLRLTVWDSGAGRNFPVKENADGVGLRNIRERLATYYGPVAKLSLETSATSGTEAVINLPVNK